MSDPELWERVNREGCKFIYYQNQDICMDELVAKVRGAVKPDIIVVDRAVEGPNQNYLTPESGSLLLNVAPGPDGRRDQGVIYPEHPEVGVYFVFSGNGVENDVQPGLVFHGLPVAGYYEFIGARSPDWNQRTRSPTWVTPPPISYPGTMGNLSPLHSPLAACRGSVRCRNSGSPALHRGPTALSA